MSSNRKAVACTACGGQIPAYGGREVSLLGEHCAHHPGQCDGHAQREADTRAAAKSAGFAWQCAMVEPSTTADAPQVCHSSGTGQAGYAAHMKTHGKTAVKADGLIRLRKPRPPARREHKPGALDPGQPMTWKSETPGYWTGPGYGDGEWAPSVVTERTGVIWSDGPYARGYWVIPDDAPGYPVLVMPPTPKRAKWGDGPSETMTAQQAHDATRRAENVRRHGVYTVVQEIRHGYGYGATDRPVYRYHSDPACPHAEGKTRETAPAYERYSVRGIIAMLTSENPEGNSPSLLCESCVWLRQPARELVTA